jgi:MFS transporter, CP family, cyanate transporter
MTSAGSGRADSRSEPARPARSAALAIAVILVALNQRPAVASVGPLLSQIKGDLGLSSAGASALTAMPVFCFGVLALAARRLARRIGLHHAVTVVLVALAVGLVVRIGPGTPALFAGTLLAAAGIALANVLLPVLVKRDFPTSTGVMMSLYTTAVVGSAAVAAGLTVPAATAIGHGWRGGLGVWVVPVLIALPFWLPQTRGDRALREESAEHLSAQLWRDRLAWMVTVYFGLQSLSFYAVLSWLPSLYQAHGYSAAAAGGLLSISTLVQLPVALVVPLLAERLGAQRGLVAFAMGMTALGILGLLVAPTSVPVLWVTLLGLGQGAAFAVALIFLVLRSRDHDSTAQLSVMAQSIGYVIAGLGPLLVGALHSWTGGWDLSLEFLLVLLVPTTVAGLRAAEPGFVRIATAAPAPDA